MGIDATLFFEAHARGAWHFVAEGPMRRDWNLFLALGYPDSERPSDLDTPEARGLPVDASPVVAAWLKDVGSSVTSWLDEREFRRAIAWHVEHADPRSDKRPGFVPVEREWLNAMLCRDVGAFGEMIIPTLMENCGKSPYAEFDAWRVIISFSR